MIGIILTLIVFGFIGAALTHVFGYIWIGLGAAFIIVAAITVGAFILSLCCSVAGGILKGVSSGVSESQPRPERRRNHRRVVHEQNSVIPHTTNVQIAVSPERTQRE